MNDDTSAQIVLGVLNLINLLVSSYNARRINKVRTEQKNVAQALAQNGTVHAHRVR